MHDPTSMLQELTGHKHVELTSSGDKAILAALHHAKGTIQIPDQAGWLTYRRYAKMLGIETADLKTDRGVIIPEHVKKGAIIYCNPAGYFAEQPIGEIFQRAGLVIMDVTGCIGDKKLCDGRNAHIMVGSFGKWKPVDLGSGGFITFKTEELHKRHKGNEQFSGSEQELYQKLGNAASRLEYFYRICSKIKKDLKEYDIIHREKKGINVVVGYRVEEEKDKLIEYCERNKYEYTICPKYIRVLEPAISIEVKRL
ncbi:MAG: hypothetical protein ABIF10_01530 [Candidatus Woesearchaeota archaeon]